MLAKRNVTIHRNSCQGIIINKNEKAELLLFDYLGFHNLADILAFRLIYFGGMLFEHGVDELPIHYIQFADELIEGVVK